MDFPDFFFFESEAKMPGDVSVKGKRPQRSRVSNRSFRVKTLSVEANCWHFAIRQGVKVPSPDMFGWKANRGPLFGTVEKRKRKSGAAPAHT